MKATQWAFILGAAIFACIGCKKSDTEITKTNALDFLQMTFAEVKAAADAGNAQAQFELGERFHFGRGIPKDSTEAIGWWQKSAAQKFPPAELELGIAYGSGNGVPKDEQKGFSLCQAAADAGFARAQETIGMIYFSGTRLIPKDNSQAFRWFKAAAEQDWPFSQYYLALCYRDGKGTQTNLDEAIVWFQKAGNNGLANAQAALGKYYFDKGFFDLGIPARIKSDAPVSQAQLTNQNFINGVEWYHKAANQNYPSAQIFLVYAYSEGAGVTKDPIEAYKWFVLAKTGSYSNLWSVMATNFTAEQISAGKLRAEEFSKTNHVVPKDAIEIPNL